MNIKRIIAWIAIILLVLLYILSFIAAILSTPGHGEFFRFTVAMTVAVPVMAWIILYAIGHSRKK